MELWQLVGIGAVVILLVVVAIAIHGVANREIGHRDGYLEGYNDGMKYVNEKWSQAMREEVK